MKKLQSYLTAILIFSLIFISCEKTNNNLKDDIAYISSQEPADLALRLGENFDKDYEKVIVNPLVITDECKYIVSGTIEYHVDGQLVATIDYGNGNCDDIATKTYDGETIEFSLNRKEKDDYYEKIIIEPLVSTEDCDFIRSGTIEFYANNVWHATIDYGDGTCDEWATKTWNVELFPDYPSGSETFSLSGGK